MIVVVVPSNRPEKLKEFREAWANVFANNKVVLIEVEDGDKPRVTSSQNGQPYMVGYQWDRVPEDWKPLIFNHTDAVRNLGFLLAAELKCKLILTLDDDLKPPPDHDPIFGHLAAMYEPVGKSYLSCSPYESTPRKVPISWFPVGNNYTRGFPYGVREEAEVWVSHGVWTGVPDYDGPSQLVNGTPPMDFFKGPIPKGCLFPFSGMNVMFRIEALPYMYYAPMGKKLGVQRFADIWCGVKMKGELDELDKAVVTGYSTVRHDRASNVFNNLEEEARGIKWNEYFWTGWDNDADPAFLEYWEKYEGLYAKWQTLTREMLK